MSNYTLRCADCGHQTPEDNYYIHCPKCKGFLEVELDEIPDNAIDDRYESIYKYHRVMPYNPIENKILHGESFEATPVVFAERLSDKLGVELYFKDETIMPSGTWKDREGFVSIHRLEKNNIKDIMVFSSGNTGTSLARSASIIRGPKLHLVIPKASKKRVNTYKEYFDPQFVNLHYFDGSNDECIVHASKLAKELGFQIEGGFSNYARREGLKLLALEIMYEWSKKVDWYVQPIAGGIGIYSYFKAYRDMGIEDQCPRMLGVQAEICAPMVNAWKANANILDEEYIPPKVIPSDFVRVLRTRRPTDSYPILKKIMDKVDGRFESVTDKQILEGLRAFYIDNYYRDVYKNKGIIVGLEPATALAGIIKGINEGYLKRGQKILLNVSGAAKAGDVKDTWLSDLL